MLYMSHRGRVAELLCDDVVKDATVYNLIDIEHSCCSHEQA